MKTPALMNRYWRYLRGAPPIAAGIVLAFGFSAGIIFWGGFNSVLDATNTEQFCIGCHSMRDNTYVEYQDSIHYNNRSGVRAICSDCHVPHEWTDKMIRKVEAINDVWGEITGSINTREKFEAMRLTMAHREWERFRANDSLSCRNCHDVSYFDLNQQDHRSAYMHALARDKGGFTCIDCHKGIAHNVPVAAGIDELSAENLVAEAESRRSGRGEEAWSKDR